MLVTDAALPREDDTAATLATNLGYYLQMSGDLPAARPYYERALAISEKALGPDHPDTARSVWWMGTFYEQEGDLDAARDCYKRAYATYARVFGEEHPHTKNVYGFLKRLSD